MIFPKGFHFWYGTRFGSNRGIAAVFLKLVTVGLWPDSGWRLPFYCNFLILKLPSTTLALYLVALS